MLSGASMYSRSVDPDKIQPENPNPVLGICQPKLFNGSLKEPAAHWLKASGLSVTLGKSIEGLNQGGTYPQTIEPPVSEQVVIVSKEKFGTRFCAKTLSLITNRINIIIVFLMIKQNPL